MKEILLIGFYQPNEALSHFLVSAQQEFKIPIRWVASGYCKEKCKKSSAQIPVLHSLAF